MTKFEGGCLCGRIRYRGEVAGAQAMSCYCKDCQRCTGSACASFVAVPEGQLEIDGETASFGKKGEAGRDVERHFCGACGSQLFSRVEVMPGMLFLKLGTLDDADPFAPSVAIWTESAPTWAPHGDVAATFPRNPG